MFNKFTDYSKEHVPRFGSKGSVLALQKGRLVEVEADDAEFVIFRLADFLLEAAVEVGMRLEANHAISNGKYLDAAGVGIT